MSSASRFLLVTATFVVALLPVLARADRPNIVWIMSEDNSKHYIRHFDSEGAATPRIESMAAHGITFDRAFSNSPVCSVARTTLITACYGPRIGTQYHRRSKLAAMPPGLKMFPAYLRGAGYHTSNRAKEDYNAIKDSEPWDESGRNASWQNRPNKETPFFHVRTFADSHESRLHFPAKQMQTPTDTDSESVSLQPYFPDTDVFRYTRARYHDRMTVIDELVGSVIDELNQSGLLETTFVFYFGDHGGVLPRSKGYAYESGLHVPLVVRVPDQYKSLAGRELGSRTNGFVEFVDFGPTVLSLAGVALPDGIDGEPFLGQSVDPVDVDARDVAFGYADRFDEKCEFIRTLRVGKWKYIRNFEGYLPDGLQNNYRYKQLAFEEWRTLHQAGKLNAIQSQFFRGKPPEMLFDIETDPHETKNLAGDPSHQAVLNDLRDRLSDQILSMPDLSLFPEAVLYDDAMENPTAFGQSNQARITSLLTVANLALQDFASAQPALEKALASDDGWERYWALIACSQFGDSAASLAGEAKGLLSDEEPLIATRAAEFLSIVEDDFDPWPTIRSSLEKADNDPEANRILNTAVYVRDFLGCKDTAQTPLKTGFAVGKSDQTVRRLDYLGQ